MNAEDRRRSPKVLVMSFQHSQNMILFQLGQRHPPARLCCSLNRRALNRMRQVLRKDDRMRRQCESPFDRMFQLTDVSRPPITVQEGHRLRGDAGHWWRFLSAIHLDEILSEQRNIFCTLA